MHDVQKVILNRLLDQNDQRYSALTKGYTNDENVVFHLRQLLARGLVEKTNGIYSITSRGVKEITQFDLQKLTNTGFKTFFIGFLCKYQDKFLVKEHPRGPTNFYNLPSGKPRFGEPMGEALIRIFSENTNLRLNSEEFSFFSLHLKTIKTKSGDVLFDDAFSIYRVGLDGNQFGQVKLREGVKWKTEREIESLQNRWPEIDICVLGKNSKLYMTYQFISNYVLT